MAFFTLPKSESETRAKKLLNDGQRLVFQQSFDWQWEDQRQNAAYS